MSDDWGISAAIDRSIAGGKDLGASEERSRIVDYIILMAYEPGHRSRKRLIALAHEIQGMAHRRVPR